MGAERPLHAQGVLLRRGCENDSRGAEDTADTVSKLPAATGQALLHGSPRRPQYLQRRLSSRDADGNRASERQHTVQSVDGEATPGRKASADIR
jgi:hypothetical protein